MRATHFTDPKFVNRPIERPSSPGQVTDHTAITLLTLLDTLANLKDWLVSHPDLDSALSEHISSAAEALSAALHQSQKHLLHLAI